MSSAMQLADLRRLLSMTQREFASILGVSQAAVSQYEAGRREPGFEVSAMYERLDAAAHALTVEERVGARTTTVPAKRWDRVIDRDRVGVVELPVRLDWSPRKVVGWRYDDDDDRRALYRLVLDVGDALDICVFIDPDELVRWRNDLLVARRVQPVLDRLVERLGAIRTPTRA